MTDRLGANIHLCVCGGLAMYRTFPTYITLLLTTGRERHLVMAVYR